MMLDTADNKIYFPRFYDIDTICSYDNSGQLKFDVDIEMEQGYWNTSSSRLWTRIRDLMHNDIVTTYNNMRQNGVSYENMMKYIYDEQIAKIPQTYYNKDYDVKYAPFADSYIGMAHGDTYEHVKRWLKQRFTFVDTLFDYAPSYNNDVLTIRANTTELMTLEIETYTPVYQHLSWYNGQMDKKKIDGKVSVEFSGTAQAATDQEVLIYGGSNVKSIKGITSMNPNRMLIGSATKLVEIDAHDCPLLADINANKANLSPHEYLNKVNLSNCPLLEGNLRLNNSPLVQEINIKGTKITGMNLPSSIRNLQVLRLPNTMTELSLNDASMLHTLEFDEGANLQSVSMTNCNALENVTGLDLLQTPSITLNNSYNNVAELYFKDTTNLSLSNMSNLERVIYTPNNEYETFELINVANAPDYKVTTFNCPKLSTFMTTAPYRESYNNGEYGDIQPNTTFTANSIDISSTQFTDVKLLCTTDTNTLKLPTTVKNFYCDSSFDLDTDWLEDGEYDVVHGELVEPYTTDYESEVLLTKNGTFEAEITDWKKGYKCHAVNNTLQENSTYQCMEHYIQVVPGSTVYLTNHTATTIGLYEYVNTNDTLVRYTSSQLISHGYRVLQADTNYIRIDADMNAEVTIKYDGVNKYTPNLIPSSADGSLIFSMYAPSNTVAPASGTWDLKGLEFDNFHTFGMNNDVRGEYEVQNIPNFEGIIFTSNCYKGTRNTSTYAGYFQMGWLNLNNATVITSDGSSIGVYVPGSTYGTKSPAKFTESCVALSFYPTVEWVKIIENGTEYHFEKSSLKLGTKNVSLNDTTAITLSVSSIVTGDLQSITMPARYDDYNITIKNAHISPKTHNTMLYPLLVNEDNPITGTLDYTNYAGKHLSWSFAYTDEEYVNIIQPKDELLNSYEYRYNVFYQTDYEFDNPYEVARYTSSASGVFPTFNAEFTYTYDEIDNGDGTYTTKIYADNLDNLPTSISFYNIKTVISVKRLNTSNVTDMSMMFSWCNNIISVDTSTFDTSNVTDMSNMFNGCNGLTSLDLSRFDTSKVADMSNMFSGCSKLPSLDLSGFDTKNVTSMGSMFNGCSGLTSLDVSNFDTSNVTDMTNMFHSCNGLTSIDVSGFDTSNVTTMNSMFYNCNKLTSLDVSGFDTGSVTNMGSMFYSCNSLTSLNLSKFDTSEVTRMDGMFNGCSALTSLNVSNFDTSKVSIMVNMFYNCSSLTSLDLSNFDTTNVINMNSMFNGCTNLTSLNVSKFNTSKVTDMGGMFRSCNKLTSLDVRGFDTKNVTDMINMFNNCNSLTSLNLSGFDTSKVTNMSSMFYSCNSLTSLDLSGFDTSNVDNMSSMFFSCSNLTSLNVTNWSSDNVNTIIPQLSVSPSTSTLYGSVVIDKTKLPGGWVYVFDDINVFLQFTASVNSTSLVTFNTSFTEYDVSVISLENNLYQYTYQYTGSNKPTYMTFYSSSETSYSYAIKSIEKLVLTNASYMANMFRECSGLTSIDLSRISISSSVDSMAGMFRACTNLTKIIGLISLDTSNVTNMSNMFNGCSKLPSLDLSGFDTSNVISMSSMFANCGQLTSLDLSGFDTSNVTTMSYMFDSCIRLTSLNLSGFKTGKVTNMSHMFYRCEKLIELDSMQNIPVALDLSPTILDATSLLDVIDNLASLKVVVNEVNCTLIESGGTDMETGEIKNGTSCVSDETFYEIYAGKTYEINTNGSWLYVSCYYTNNKAFKGSLYSGANKTNDSCIVTPSTDGYIRVSAVKAPNANTTITIKECILNPKTLTLGSTLLAKLKEDQIAIAVNKGWTVL